jgi:hypothetical protein
MNGWVLLTGWETVIAVFILVVFLVSIVISLSTKDRDLGNQDLEHFDHEPGDSSSR